MSGINMQKFGWNPEILPKEIKLSSENRSFYLKEDDYVFRTAYGSLPLNEGIFYWEIIADSRSEHELKIGVSSSNTIQKTAFSDYSTGWAFFGVG